MATSRPSSLPYHPSASSILGHGVSEPYPQLYRNQSTHTLQPARMATSPQVSWLRLIAAS